MILPDRFAPLADLFRANLDGGRELGARFTLAEEGEVVFDIWGGSADKAGTRPFDERTLTPVFSTTKAIAALLIARLVGEGRLSYEEPVAAVWPEFAENGKAEITLGQVMSHQEGLPGLPGPAEPTVWYDWERVTRDLAAMAPLWPPGTASGYHPITYGFLAGEIFRRVDGRSMGRALREDWARPLGLDLWIGLPESEFDRVAEMERPHRFADFGPLTEAKRLAFLKPWSSPGGAGVAAYRRAEIPSANGHATAEALARLLSVLGCEGRLGGRQLIAPEAIVEASRERIRGRDLVLPFDIGWAAGLMRNAPNRFYGPGDTSLGHSGWGGSCAFADPERRLSGAYVMNRQSPALIGDERPVGLIEAAYVCLGR